MKPIKFKEQNCIYAENQPGYLPLPAFKDSGSEGQVISCWKLTFIERLRLLFTGRIWLALLSFHEPLTPNYLSTKKSDIFK